MLRLLYVDDCPKFPLDILSLPVVYEAIAEIALPHHLLRAVERHHPDVLLIRSRTPSTELLNALALLHQALPRPVLLFATSTDPDLIRTALSAGVSAYVVEDWNADKLASVLLVALLRFDEAHRLRMRLQQVEAQLADRKVIDRAKGLLMDKRQMNEIEAFAALRTQAMNQGIKLGDAARQVVALAEFIGG